MLDTILTVIALSIVLFACAMVLMSLGLLILKRPMRHGCCSEFGGADDHAGGCGPRRCGSQAGRPQQLVQVSTDRTKDK